MVREVAVVDCALCLCSGDTALERKGWESLSLGSYPHGAASLRPHFLKALVPLKAPRA